MDTRAAVNHHRWRVRAGELIGESIYNTGGESLGEIEDDMLNRNDNTVAALVGMGRFPGVDEKRGAALLNDLEMRAITLSSKLSREQTSTKGRLPAK